SRRVVVVGGGVAGLATAYRLAGGSGGAHAVSSDLDVVVLEAEGSPGGKVRSVDVAGIEVEAGPDSLLARKPAGVELCRELGLGPELEAPATGSTLIWTERGSFPFRAGRSASPPTCASSGGGRACRGGGRCGPLPISFAGRHRRPPTVRSGRCCGAVWEMRRPNGWSPRFSGGCSPATSIG